MKLQSAIRGALRPEAADIASHKVPDIRNFVLDQMTQENTIGLFVHCGLRIMHNIIIKCNLDLPTHLHRLLKYLLYFMCVFMITIHWFNLLSIDHSLIITTVWSMLNRILVRKVTPENYGQNQWLVKISDIIIVILAFYLNDVLGVPLYTTLVFTFIIVNEFSYFVYSREHILSESCKWIANALLVLISVPILISKFKELTMLQMCLMFFVEVFLCGLGYIIVYARQHIKIDMERGGQDCHVATVGDNNNNNAFICKQDTKIDIQEEDHYSVATMNYEFNG